ncbi:hypothetical protein, variant [Aphanomyces invadans]|uniref:Uncharacterized protein n=1 Tax=Aphanomyces invadans TaxID=157072 RepID=A0A024U0W0_9STRA|nr:hypothetical protein, variant [Aphanomyces invadans]ETV99849.1 hypothetical protein, variant [Aphanomyces invadans]|eukprot:XP_008871625.1 hypothetical protein, variant [Aphanomyces invadans]
MELLVADLAATAPAAMDTQGLNDVLDQVRAKFPRTDNVSSSLSESLNLLQAAWTDRKYRPNTATLALLLALVAIETVESTHKASRELEEAWTLLRDLQTTTASQPTSVTMHSSPVVAFGFALATHPLSQSFRCPASIVFDVAFEFTMVLETLTTDSELSGIAPRSNMDTSALVSAPFLHQPVAALLHDVSIAAENALYAQFDLIAEQASSSDLQECGTHSARGTKPLLAAALAAITALTTALVSCPFPSIDATFLAAAIEVISWSSFPIHGSSTESNARANALKILFRLAGNMSPSQVHAVVALIQAALHSTTTRTPPLSHDVFRGHRLHVYLQFLAQVPQLDMDVLFELALHGVGHSWTPLQQYTHRILRALMLHHPGAATHTSEMGAVYIRRMVETLHPNSKTELKDLATTMGVVVMHADSALFRFAVLELYDKWLQDRSTHVAALVVELVKVAHDANLHFTMQVVEKMAWKDTSTTMLDTIYRVISGPCDASRRVVLVEWFLGLQTQVAPALQSRL